MKNATLAVVFSLGSLLAVTGCGSCGERDAPVESTPQATQADPATSSTSVSLMGPRQKAPALKGALAPSAPDGGHSGK